MRTNRVFAVVGVVIGAFGATGCTSPERGTAATTPQLTPTQQKEKQDRMRQAELDARAAQINSSNLPPEQKQALLNQMRATAGK